MSITVYDCLKLPSLHSGKVVAGKIGLDRIVSSVSVVEIPEEHREIKVFNPNELSVSALYAVKDNPAAQYYLAESPKTFHCKNSTALHIYQTPKKVVPLSGNQDIFR